MAGNNCIIAPTTSGVLGHTAAAVRPIRIHTYRPFGKISVFGCAVGDACSRSI